jgi:hypothetical protein
VFHSTSKSALRMSADLPSVALQQLGSATSPDGVLLTTFTDAGGYLTALNWAQHVAQAGCRPTIGIDGPAPSKVAQQWRATGALSYALPGRSSAAANGLERWTTRWLGLESLLKVDGVHQVVLSDTDVVWLRNPSPYFAALARLHPFLDVAVGTDHATYAEAFRDDVPYSSTATPTRRSLLAQWQRVNSSSGAVAGSAAPDFDLDPHPANGARDGTWNPGVLLVRATKGGRAFVTAELDALFDAGRDKASLAARGLKDASYVSDQSEMCRMLRRLLAMDASSRATGMEHAQHSLDPSLLHMPLQMPLSHNTGTGSALQASHSKEPDMCHPQGTSVAVALGGGGRARRRALRRAAKDGAAATTFGGSASAQSPPPWWCTPSWRDALRQRGLSRIDASASVGLLPVLQFGSFLATKIVREGSLYGVTPFALHATHIVGSGIVFARNNLRPMGPCAHPLWCLGASEVTPAAVKALTMRQYGLWAVDDPPWYFEGSFLTYSNRPARRFRRFTTHASGDAQWEAHLRLLQEQLQDFQAALAAALALNRTLVLPRMLCSCVYAQWPFVGKGNLNCQPMHMQGLFPRMYECPPSYWLSMPSLLRTDVPLREPSFLEYEKAAPLRGSRLTLHACDPPRAAAPANNGGADGSNHDGPAAQLCTVRGVPVVRARASYDEFARAVGPLRKARLLHIEAPRMAVAGFASKAASLAFARRASALLGTWCCSEGNGRGERGGGGGKRRRGAGDGIAAPQSTADSLNDGVTDGDASLLQDVTEEDRIGLFGTAFKLRFRPRLGVVRRDAGGAPRTRWEVVNAVNNVFGRAELKQDTSCCKYIGQAASLGDCTAKAERRGGATSVTWHRARSESGAWAGTCYAIVDATWTPVPVEKGQAEADSARLVGGRPLGPAPELAAAWITD